MSRRLVAPIFLLIAAACSLAAVFGVQRIESRGGPVGQPSATTWFSPNDDGGQDDANVRFTNRERQRVTVDVVDADGARVVVIVEDEQVSGPRTYPWDGRNSAGDVVADGPYRFRIKVDGDPRTYAPTVPTNVDTEDPIGVIDRSTFEAGQLRGLAMLGEHERLVVDHDTVSRNLRQFTPAADAESAQPMRPAPANTRAVRFTIPLDQPPSRIEIVDLAGNRVTGFPARGLTIAVFD